MRFSTGTKINLISTNVLNDNWGSCAALLNKSFDLFGGIVEDLVLITRFLTIN